MTCLYNSYFAGIWLTNVLSIPAALAFFVWALAWNQAPHRLALGLSISAVALVWVVYLRLHGPRVLMRAAAWPVICTGDYFPTTEEQLVDAALGIYAKTGKPPTIVGSDWGYFLYRKGPQGPRIFLHNFNGKQSELMSQRWRSGTTIARVNKVLKAQNLTFSSHPTMDYISLGAWFACSNHGNGGATAGKSSDSLKNARVLDMTNPDREKNIELIKYPEIRKRFDGVNAFKFCILDCEFHNLAKNSDVQKRCIVVDSPEAAAAWLDPTQHLRLLFLGAARNAGLGVPWGPLYDSDYHGRRGAHFCSRWCNFFQVDVCSAIGGWYESASYEVEGVKYLKNYTDVTTRYEANRWMPIVWPIQTIAVVLGGYRNFEIFFKLKPVLDGKTLWELVKALITMHQAHGGRSEIRHGAPDGAICLDVSMNKQFDEPFRLLKTQFDVTKVALHPGKWNDRRELTTRPCARVPIGSL